MALIATIPTDTATGQVKKTYDLFSQEVGRIPAPLKLTTASPGIFQQYTNTIGYYMDHPTLSPILLASIRFAVAVQQNYMPCVAFNEFLLDKHGWSPEIIAQVKQNPANAPLDHKDVQLLLFVLKALKTPTHIDDAAVNTLRDVGWNDESIFDAAYHGSILLAMGPLINAFHGEAL